MNMITIKHCANEVEAEILHSKLKEEGIVAYVTAENMAFGVPGSAIGQQISLAVNDEDVSRANIIIATQEKHKEAAIPWCPNCGSEEVLRNIISRKHMPYWVWSFVVAMSAVGMIVPSFFFSIICLGGALMTAISWFIPYKTEEFVCKRCGNKFKRQ